MNKIKEFFAQNKAVIIPTVVMLCISIVVTGALAGTNIITKDKIKQQEIIQQNSAMKEVLPSESYNEKSYNEKGEEFTYYSAVDSGKVTGYIFVTSVKGYGGDVKVMTAVNIDGTIKSVKVLDVTSETPGLGQNAGNSEWYSQFNGLKTDKEIKVIKNGAKHENNEINAVTGATISSNAVKNAVDVAIGQYKQITKEDNDE